MLNVKSHLPGNPLVRIECNQTKAVAVAAELVRQCASFYYEPYPDERGVFMVDPEHAPLVNQILLRLL